MQNRASHLSFSIKRTSKIISFNIFNSIHNWVKNYVCKRNICQKNAWLYCDLFSFALFLRYFLSVILSLHDQLGRCGQPHSSDVHHNIPDKTINRNFVMYLMMNLITFERRKWILSAQLFQDSQENIRKVREVG